MEGMTEMQQWKSFSPFPIVWSSAVWVHVCLMVIATFCLAPAALIFQIKKCSKHYLIVQILQFTVLWVAIILVSTDPMPSRRNELTPIDDEHPWSNKHHSSSVHSLLGWLSALIYTLVTVLVITSKRKAKDRAPEDTKLENTRDNSKALFASKKNWSLQPMAFDFNLLLCQVNAFFFMPVSAFLGLSALTGMCARETNDMGSVGQCIGHSLIPLGLCSISLLYFQNLHLSKSKPTEHALVLACNGTNGESKPDSDTKPLSLMENGHISNSQDEDRALKIWFWNSSLSLENVENTMAVLGGLGYFIGCWMNEWNPRKRAFGVPGWEHFFISCLWMVTGMTGMLLGKLGKTNPTIQSINKTGPAICTMMAIHGVSLCLHHQHNEFARYTHYTSGICTFVSVIFRYKRRLDYSAVLLVFASIYLLGSNMGITSVIELYTRFSPLSYLLLLTTIAFLELFCVLVVYSFALQ